MRSELADRRLHLAGDDLVCGMAGMALPLGGLHHCPQQAKLLDE